MSKMPVLNLSNIAIGPNARLFPKNWRPIREEIAFAKEHGFKSIQISVKAENATEKWFDDSFIEVSKLLKDADITAVMEIRLFLDENGLTADAKTPLDILKINLPAIIALPVKYVHWHWAPSYSLHQADNKIMARLEQDLVPQLKEAVKLAEQHKFIFAFEHNEAAIRLHASAKSCLKTLKQVAGLKFVWDMNHNSDIELDEFKELIPYMSVLHVSDTALPELNYHLPLGQGNIDFAKYFQTLKDFGFSGPAILEIGGLPKSGGFGKDTDAALVDSLDRLEQILATLQY